MKRLHPIIQKLILFSTMGIITMSLLSYMIPQTANAEQETVILLSDPGIDNSIVEPRLITPVPTPSPEPTPEEPPIPEPTLDRTQPLYEVYKNGFQVDVSTDLQWMIRDMCEKYDFPESLVYGCIIAESTFHADARNGNCMGLAQINKFWIGGANIKHFTDDYASRDLLNPEHNLLTLFEMWCYARDTWGIDVYSESGQKDLLYWHNCGEYIKNVNWPYSEKCLGYASELVKLQ